MERCRAALLLALTLLAACTPGSERADRPKPSASSTTAATSGAPCPQRQPTNETEGIDPLTHLQMVSDRRGFAAGDGVILATSDGESWEKQYSGPDQFVFIDAVDSEHAWAVGRRDLLGTTDGGRQWTSLGQPAGAALRQVHFFSAQAGWGVGGGKLFRTADGGRSWEALDAPCGADAVCFTGPDDGWVAAGSRVDRSSDGGESWSLAFQVPGPPRPFVVDELQCARPDAVWAVFTGTGAALSHVPYVVYRGSATAGWTALAKEAMTGPEAVDAPPAGSYPPLLSALGPDEAVVITFTPPRDPPVGMVLATGGGRDLEGAERPVAGISFPSAASFRSPDRGWIVGRAANFGDRGVILATFDGGRTWQEQYSHRP